MTQEELFEHIDDICNHFIPLIISPDQDEIMGAIKELPIDDIIIIYANSQLSFDKGFFVDVNKEALEQGKPIAKKFFDATLRIRGILIEKLKTADTLWVLYDKTTKSPFITHSDEVLMFTEKDKADEGLNICLQNGRTTFKISEINNNAEVFFTKAAYMNGVKGFVINPDGPYPFTFKREEIVSDPNNSIPLPNRPITNPDFFRAVAKFQQELYDFGEYENKKETLRGLKDEIATALQNARFLVPAKGLPVNGIEEAAKNGEKSTISIPYLSKPVGGENITYTPVFTNWDEFRKVYSEEKGFDGLVLHPEDLLSSRDDYIVIDAASLAFEVSKGEIRQML